MIVRIATEGQYELDDEDSSELNRLDNDAVSICESGDERKFATAFSRLLAFIRERGRALGDDDLRPSDLILPPPDVSFAEARAEFKGEGLIPG